MFNKELIMENEEWELTEERVNFFEFSGTKCFNLLISDKMFKRLEVFGKKHVKDLIAEIVSVGVDGLEFMKTDCAEWKMFHHIIPEDELRKYRNERKKRKQQKSDENTSQNDETGGNVPKKRKHYHHFVDLSISRKQYDMLLEAHNRLNTFSIAMIIRMLVEIFLDLNDKYGDKNIAFQKLVQTIRKMHDKGVNCRVEFILLKLRKKASNAWRAVAYFQVEYLDESNNRLYFFRLKL